MMQFSQNRLPIVMLLAFALPAFAQDSGSGARTEAVKEKPETNVEAKADDAIDAKIREVLKHVNPKINPDYIGPSPVPGCQEVIIGGQVVFITEFGQGRRTYICNRFARGQGEARERRTLLETSKPSYRRPCKEEEALWRTLQ
jgi:Disulfide bond isomerase protein N-terminus